MTHNCSKEYRIKYVAPRANNVPIEILIEENNSQKLCTWKLVSNEEDHPTGIVFEDEYLVIIRDTVRFPDGEIGTYLRLYEKPLQTDSVAILARCKDKFVLVKHYRHASNKWHLEIPRGRGSRQANKENATQEINEELGVSAFDLKSLGFLYSNSGLSGSRTELFTCNVDQPFLLDKHEGIESAHLLTLTEFRKAIASNKIDDSYTLSAFARWSSIQNNTND